jgi:hypothetical protein
MRNDIRVDCCLCEEYYETTIDLPDTWTTRYESISEEKGFCPKHSKVAEWADGQCPGCVGSWGDCDLWRDFAYSRRHGTVPLTEQDFDKIRRGVCPRRTNGTFMTTLDRNGFRLEDVHLDKQATTESGELLAQAIKDYIERYKNE